MIFIRFVDPVESNFMRINAESGQRRVQHEWVDLEDVSLYFPNAVIASEDQTFPEHFGFDIKQIATVLNQNKNGKGFARGASTLSQQIVKNLFLWPEKSMTRKALEAWYTLWLELIVPKSRIMELYVNFAQLGKSTFGVQAASKLYFGTTAKHLSPYQAALLAASLPTPSRSSPSLPSAYLQQRAEYIMDQMPRVGGRRMVRELD